MSKQPTVAWSARLRRHVAVNGPRSRIGRANAVAHVESMVEPADALNAFGRRSCPGSHALQENVSLLELVRRSYPFSCSDAMRGWPASRGFATKRHRPPLTVMARPFELFPRPVGLRRGDRPLSRFLGMSLKSGWAANRIGTYLLARRASPIASRG